MTNKGYTTNAAVASYLGVTLTTAQQAQCDALIGEAENWIDFTARRQWIAPPITGEVYDLANLGTRLYLRTVPVASIQSIQTRTYVPGDQPYTLTAGVEYELIDPSIGLVTLSTAYGSAAWYSDYAAQGGSLIYSEAGALLDPQAHVGALALVSYTPAAPVPGDIAQAATMLAAHWLEYTLFPQRFDVAELRTADQTLKLIAGPNGRTLPQEVVDLVRGRRTVIL